MGESMPARRTISWPILVRREQLPLHCPVRAQLMREPDGPAERELAAAQRDWRVFCVFVGVVM